MNQPPTTGRIGPDRDLLSRYLDDHLLAATTGVRLFDAARKSFEDTPHGQVLARLGREISADRADLLRLIHSLGFTPSKVKLALGHLGAQVSKVNPINPLRSHKGAGAQLELESLQSAIRGKECLWETLLALAESGFHLGAFDAARLTDLRDRARKQGREAAEIMLSTAADRFSEKNS